MTSEVYTHTFTIPATAIDSRGHVNNVTYLEWCIDAAEAHWKRNATKAMKMDYVWYVLRHEIDYKASAFEGEKVEVRTWVTKAEGVKSERCYRIFRITDDTLLLEAKTTWCLLDANSHRPMGIPEEIRNLF